MAKKLYEETNIYNIACALREKCGDGSKTYKTCDMADAIRALDTGGGEINPDLVLTGRNSYRFYDKHWDWFLDIYGNRITTNDLEDTQYMFWGSDVESLPFDFNYKRNNETASTCMFNNCRYLVNIGKITNFKPKYDGLSYLFYGCTRLRYLPEFENCDFSQAIFAQRMCSSCYSLRQVDSNLLSGMTNITSFSDCFTGCYTLDEINNFPVNINANIYSSRSLFTNAFDSCYRIKNFTFATQENGEPYIASWANQDIRLSSYTGYAFQSSQILNHNSGITADKEVIDDATYQALKNDPDWWTTDIQYSRYNRISAVNTINSLPDCSAYIASTSGFYPNTISFKGAAGSLTDGGAINTMTEEEIAVAAAKGWTVSFS